MTVPDLKAMLASQRSEALSVNNAAELSTDRERAMDYYLGRMPDLPAQDGRSSAVSSDVADTIEGLMPSLMDIFAGSDEVVRFEPVGPEDEEAAQQETDYVNHVFMQRNPGFMTLYSFIKDALLSKVGIVKVWWEEREEEERETYYGLTEDQFMLLSQAVLMSKGSIKIVEHTEHNEMEAA
ncbi:portal protein [Tardiphaga sp. 538_B7_N1_4]|uniref:portal protein n=1 Tax=Tardiphaga sp. 538_B7_N1_4 TaxID=3240778 RepID=UPI003F26CBA9